VARTAFEDADELANGAFPVEPRGKLADAGNCSPATTETDLMMIISESALVILTSTLVLPVPAEIWK
jgi:hypothetical protein